MPITIGISKRSTPNANESCVLVCMTSSCSGNGTMKDGVLAQTEMTADEARAYAKMFVSAADTINPPYREPRLREFQGAVPP